MVAASLEKSHIGIVTLIALAYASKEKLLEQRSKSRMLDKAPSDLSGSRIPSTPIFRARTYRELQLYDGGVVLTSLVQSGRRRVSHRDGRVGTRPVARATKLLSIDGKKG